MAKKSDRPKNSAKHRKAFKQDPDVAKARREIWKNRDVMFKPLRDAGFTVSVLDEYSRHTRIHTPGLGWFDFWPTTGRWIQSPQSKGKVTFRGTGFAALVAALEKIRPEMSEKLPAVRHRVQAGQTLTGEEIDARNELIARVGETLVDAITGENGEPEIGYWRSLISMLNAAENQNGFASGETRQLPNGELVDASDPPWT